jgi:cell division protein ZapA (FtsZ GTPase activity inhibitor)
MKEERKGSVEVELMGQKFRLRGENEEYVKKVSEYVNQEIQKVKATGRTTSLEIALLAAMNIADNYFSGLREQQVTVNGLLGKTDKLISFIDERLN